MLFSKPNEKEQLGGDKNYIEGKRVRDKYKTDVRHHTPERQGGFVVSLAKTPIVKVMNPLCR